MNLKKVIPFILFFLLSGCFSDFDDNFFNLANNEDGLPVPTHSVSIILFNNSSYWVEALLTSSSINVATSSTTRDIDYDNCYLKPNETSEICLLQYDSDYSENELNNCIRFFDLILEFADDSKVYFEGLPENMSDKSDAAYYGFASHQGVDSGFVSFLNNDDQYSTLAYAITINGKDDIEIQIDKDNSKIYSPKDKTGEN